VVLPLFKRHSKYALWQAAERGLDLDFTVNDCAQSAQRAQPGLLIFQRALLIIFTAGNRNRLPAILGVHMDGILCIDKPQDYTSFDVVARIRGMSGTKRVGHSGTLDPMATGVLPLFLGTATKGCGMLPDERKHYTADFRLGEVTDTLDVWGKTLDRRESRVTREELLARLPDFCGKIWQVPPMYSAVRVKGQRLYDIARQGGEVERTPRQVEVCRLELLSFDEESQSGRLEVLCQKGTYVRSLISDLGESLGPGGIMTGLVRTQAGGFTLDDCITLEEAQQLASEERLTERLLPVDRLFSHLPAVFLGQVQTDKFKHGVQLDLNRLRYKDVPGLHRVYGPQKQFLGLASLQKEDMSLKIEKLFWRPDA